MQRENKISNRESTDGFSKLIKEAHESVKDVPYSLGKWDCLSLAKYLSDYVYGIGKFPDCLDKFSKLNEVQASIAIENFLPVYATEISELINGSLVVIKIKNRNNLASYYDDSLYYMGNVVMRCEVDRMSSFIDSIWELK